MAGILWVEYTSPLAELGCNRDDAHAMHRVGGLRAPFILDWIRGPEAPILAYAIRTRSGAFERIERF